MYAIAYLWLYCQQRNPMKLTHTILATTLACLSLPRFASEDPNRDLKDFIAYFRSVRTPVVIALCATIVDDKEAFEQTATKWLQANAESIERGKNIALSRMTGERQLDDSNKAMLAELKDEFAKDAQDGKVSFCADARKSLTLQSQRN